MVLAELLAGSPSRHLGAITIVPLVLAYGFLCRAVGFHSLWLDATVHCALDGGLLAGRIVLSIPTLKWKACYTTLSKSPRSLRLLPHIPDKFPLQRSTFLPIIQMPPESEMIVQLLPSQLATTTPTARFGWAEISALADPGDDPVYELCKCIV